MIYSRALPDARDGLKPVQRRILYTMSDMNLRPDRGHVKSARVVGEVMGRLHPHGDGAIYDALVRQAQSWTMRLPMVDGHGNFGSPDDSPAAMRYTECRMAPPAVAMTDSIEEDTVDFKPNYDSRETEPVVLPAAIPNLIVNGATGIAVGMATNIAPHNLVEVVQALRHLIGHPDATVDDLMRFIPGPDLPTGGKIVGLDGIRDAYETGKGSFRMRATARVENVGRRKGIVVTELPYGVGTERVVERIKLLVQGKKVQGIADIKDLTDREHGPAAGDRGQERLRPGGTARAALQADADGGLLRHQHRRARRRPAPDAGPQAAARRLPGPPLRRRTPALAVPPRQEGRPAPPGRRAAVALLDIDEVIQVIRTSDDTATARERLISVFDLSQPQADYILEMQLRRLTRFSRIELEKEQEELKREIEELDAILADAELLRTVVADELAEVARTYGTPRRTVLLQSAGSAAVTAAAAPLEVADDPCFAYLSASGLLARSGSDDLPGQGESRANHDVIVSAVRTTVRGEVGVITSRGRCLRLAVLDLPGLPAVGQRPQPAGRAAAHRDAVAGPGREGAGADLAWPPTGPGWPSAPGRAWSSGSTPRCSAATSGTSISLKDGDEVVGAVELAPATRRSCFVTAEAQLLHFPASLVRPQGRSGGGMAGVKLGAGDRVGVVHRARPGDRRCWSRRPAPAPRCPAPSRARSR